MFLKQTAPTAPTSNIAVAQPPQTASRGVLKICALCAALGSSFFSPQALASAKDFAGFTLGADLD
jgi:hypothetical protein